MSGGVDSSYCAMWLKSQGYEVSGLYLKLHENPAYHEKNINNIDLVCRHIGIPYQVMDAQERFRERVYDYFVHSYKDGVTPNPCAVCNPNIKFGIAYDYAMEQGSHYLASGHYVKTDGEYFYQAEDKNKDQSYFLFAVPKERLKNLIFPMAERLKEDIKQEALDIPYLSAISEGGESQEICFVDNTYIDILQKHFDVEQEGEVHNEAGEVIGTHKGYMQYTIGKRRGFTVKGAHDPHYVLSIDSQKNIIVAGEKESLAINRVEISGINLFEEKSEFECQVKLRYRMEKIPAKVLIEGNRGTILLSEPAYGVACGQAAVFYEGEKLLGGGWIDGTQ